MSNIVVVDDDPGMVYVVKRIMEKDGHTVMSANSGVEALDLIKEHKPDLILLDVMMPGMDGFEVCKTIKSDPDLKGIKVAMLTAKVEDKDKIKGLEASRADWYITKPFEKEKLKAMAQWLLNSPPQGEEGD